MYLYPKISPLIWWLIIIFAVAPIASAAIAITYDVVGEGSSDIESDLFLGRTRITSDGAMAASQKITASTDLYDSTTLTDLDDGFVHFKTANLDTRAKGEQLKSNVNLNYNFVHVIGEPDVIEGEDGKLYLHTENQTKHYETDTFSITGINGSLHQEAIMAVAGKKRKIFDANLKGNLSFEQIFQASGIELIESLEALPDEETIDEAEAEQIVRDSFRGFVN